jgi:hypothetical protein
MQRTALTLIPALLLSLLCLPASGQKVVRPAPWDSDPSFLRGRDLGLSRAELLGARAARSLELELFEGRRTRARWQRIEETRGGGTTWYGKLDSDPAGYVAIVARGKAVVGVLREKGKLYRVRNRPSGALVLYECLPQAPGGCGTPREGPPLPVDSERSTSAPTTGRTRTGGGSTPPSEAEPSLIPETVDVLVAWTQEAEDAAGGQGVIEAIIDLAVLETNVAFANSVVGVEVRLVHSARIDYVESGDQATDLARLQDPGDGHMDEIHLWRDVYGADSVSLLIANDEHCGRSYNMGAPASTAFAPYAVNLVAQSCATGYYAFAHELGHGFGLDHDRENTKNTPSTPYAYGFWTANGQYRTIMALERWGIFGTRIQYFSNPRLFYEGAVIGVNPPSPYAADCARTLNENAPIFTAFRPTTLASTAGASPCAVGQSLVVQDSLPRAGGRLQVVLADPGRDVMPGAYPVVIASLASIQPSCGFHNLVPALDGLVTYTVGAPWQAAGTSTVTLNLPAVPAGIELCVQTLFVDFVHHQIRVTDPWMLSSGS